MTIDVGTLLSVLEACDSVQDEVPLISFVVPQKGGGTGQIFLPWVPGRTLKDYLKSPALHGVISVYQACYSRIVDHTNVKRRLLHVPRAGDEIRFIPGAMK